MPLARLEGTEQEHQEALFDWAAKLVNVYPCLALLFHVPNGGKRDKSVALAMQRAGVKPGVPDICLPVPCHPWHGLYIELKVGKNKPEPDQLKWLEALRQQGYFVYVAYGWSDAAAVICDYLGIDAPH